MRDNHISRLPATWQTCMQRFLEANPSPSSRERYRSTLKCFLRHIGTIPLDEVTGADIEAFVDSCSRHRNHGKSSTPNTKSRRRSIVTAFYRYASTYLVEGKPLYQQPFPDSAKPSEQPTKNEPFAHLSDAWQSCISSFLDGIQDISGSAQSRKAYETTLRLFLSDGDRAPDAYTPGQVGDFLKRPSTSPRNPGADITPGTRNNRLSQLVSFYAFAARFEWEGKLLLQTQPPTRGERYVKVGSKYRGMTMTQFEQLLAAIPDDTEKGCRDRAMLLLYFFSGRRRQEVARLRWGDFHQGIVVDPGGNRRTAITFTFVSKGRSRELQQAECASPAWQAIMHYLQVSGRLETMQPDSPLFTSTRQGKGQAPLSACYCNIILKEYARAAGLPADISLHSIRHCGARARYENGMDLLALKSWLGHSSLDTTWRYVQGLSGVSDNFAQVLEQRFSFLSAR